MIDIRGLDKADVLIALYDASRPLGIGFLHFRPGSISKEEARNILKSSSYIDYLHGRVIKVDLFSNKTFDEFLYDRDNGKGAAAAAIDKLRKSYGS